MEPALRRISRIAGSANEEGPDQGVAVGLDHGATAEGSLEGLSGEVKSFEPPKAPSDLSLAPPAFRVISSDLELERPRLNDSSPSFQDEAADLQVGSPFLDIRAARVSGRIE